VKKAIGLFLGLFLLFSLAACNKQQTRSKPVVAYEIGEKTDDVILENAFLRLRFLPQTTEIILLDKIRGAEWRSTPADAARDSFADVVTKDMMRSQLSLKYADVSGVGETQHSISQSVERGSYNYELVDGGIEVNYTIGNVPRTFLFPTAASQERLLPFLEKMESSDRRKTEANYRLYDINNLYTNDDKNALLAKYPILANEKLYVLRDSVQEYMKEQMEELFIAAGYTRDDYLEDAALYAASAGDEKPAFTVTLRYSLDGNSLVVSVPFDKIAYRTAYPITRLDILPFMGAGGLNDNGYLLVPDGSGALIYFNNGKQNQIASTNPIYGWDEAMPRDVVVTDSKPPFPAFGIQKNGSALLCVIEDGSAYSSVYADVSGRNSSYNIVYPYFDMIHGAVMDISGRSDRAVYLYESSLPQDEKITLRYTPCARDGYVGMAKEYRSWLLKKFPDMGNRPSIDTLPIAVEIVGAVNKTQHRLGIPVDLPLKLTSYKETSSMINDFADFGWKNVKIKLNGWFNRGVDHSTPTKIKLINELGRGNFPEIVSAAQKNNYDLFPEVDFSYMRDLHLFDGFSLYRDAARYVSRKRVEKYPFSFVWYGERTRWGKLNYLSRPAATMNMIDGFLQKAAPMGIQNIAFRNLGSKLSGDYNERRRVSREASMIMRQEKFSQIVKSGGKYMVNAGYLYAVPWADFIVDMAVDSQNFGITDVSIPFYQIVLHGLVPYTGRAINLAEDYTKNLLQTIEGGGGLYFSFMAEESVELQETKFRQFYANEYDKWIGDANELYRRFSSDFAGLYSQPIENHVILSHGVTVTEYENGTGVVVNKSENDWNYNGIIIKANNYGVLRRGE